MEKEHVVDDLPAYALGILDEEEAVQVIRHLQGCAACRNELESYQVVTNRLAFAAPSVEFPTGLRQRIVETASTYARGSGIVQRQKYSKPRQQILIPWRLVGALVIVLLALSNLLVWQQLVDLRSTVVPSFQTVALAGTELHPDANGMLVISHDGKHGTLVVEDLPPLEESKEYQLWLIRNGNRVSGGTFSVSRDGYASMWVSAPDPLGSYPTFGITIEPVGGSPGPTGDKVMGGDI
ncbi:MAG: hypothetical protein EHM41_20420 [Chloroflexi bacterium]|nr:MAG: hypothetical protein EHM41_20420 [Chloroflexota bacterium]